MTALLLFVMCLVLSIVNAFINKDIRTRLGWIMACLGWSAAIVAQLQVVLR